MLDRFAGFRQGREPLSSMAYFCLTVLERNPGGRAEAAKKFGISRNVLEKVGKLTSKKGGTEARKACGLHSDLQSGERRFLEEKVKQIIRRVAEVAHDASAIHPKITISLFPGP